MARFFYRFLPKKSFLEAEQTLEQAKKLINSKDRGYDEKQVQTLIRLVDEREIAFRNQIGQFMKQSDQQPYINSFYAFAKTLKDYFENPSEIEDPLSRYHNSGLYCYVGETRDLSYTFADNASRAFLYSGLGLLVLSLMLIPVNLPLALITLGVSISFLAPSSYYTFGITRPNEALVYKKEEELFNTAVAVATHAPTHPANDEMSEDGEHHHKVQGFEQ
ncbi:hypothetical protein [Legionella micdadei]|uniref:23, 7 kDa protein n=1 Tax=Legionella micdadei TaxID=451 RepID=A0A098GFC7_LEGMI|nr:hypothetical protein [Legionella micdadei]ARG97365.1 hypothetical protein B6N58_06640 [Legionella micdadei]ARH00327.1 hypothetical protein B6V88_07780 [Legionella micdadei]KTD28250.1 hypothetical protein Lmic_1361 [Legionella micdadei]NSL16879.1 hypothetical protein [Legionella micdadei]CEG61163.1 protein of unknown function [Legionella micdadei]